MSLENKETKPAQATEEGKETNPQVAATDNGLPKTQEELDAFIEKRLARERKKMASQHSCRPDRINSY